MRFCETRRRFAHTSGGFTLVEMLVTIVVTLLLMLAMVQFFEWVGNSTREGRAAIEMAGPLRGAAQRLQADLDLLTVPVRPWPNPGSGLGYFEYYEGAGYDDTSGTTVNINGDTDDILMFTVRSLGEPFVGRLGSTTYESFDAEVIWWVKWDDLNGDGVVDPAERVLRRRVLLILPNLSLSGYAPTTTSGSSTISFFNDNDISAHPNVGGTAMVANSLEDLTQRENRFGHDPRVVTGATTLPTFPFRITTAVMDGLAQVGTRAGEDIMLSNMLAFDVRAYDPSAQIRLNAGLAVVPGDPGWTGAAGAASVIGRGAYVDLNYSSYVGSILQSITTGPADPSIFSAAPQAKSQLNAISGNPVMATYDTWSYYYERNPWYDSNGSGSFNSGEPGDEDADGTLNEGTNGLDDDGTNGVDDPGERETSPPYTAALRGLQVRIRTYEPDTRQLKQTSVTADFLPD